MQSFDMSMASWLTRQQVNYRQLSRALKVHSNLAKQMLYEFHRKQNAKKPGSVHATYLLTGTRRVETPAPQTNGGANQDEDTPMQSSPPFPSSSAPKQDVHMDERQSVVRSIMLVKQEDLEQARAVFDAISSIHIYSLEANTLKDLNVLTECNRKVRAEYASEDPLVAWKQYGTIQNSNAKRRTRRTAPPPPPAATDSKVKATTVAAKKDTPAAVKAESRPPSAKGTPEPTATKPASKPSGPKRDTSNIFKSFSKAASKPKKQDSQSSTETTPAPPAAPEKEDEPMGGFSDDEGDDDDMDTMPTTAASKKAAPSGKSKKEREAELQAMMEAEEEQPKIERDEDEEMGDAPSPPTPPGDEEEHQGIAAGKKEDEKEREQAAETVTVENGRRRGRRRVMKKKTVKDEEGYLGEPCSFHTFSV